MLGCQKVYLECGSAQRAEELRLSALGIEVREPIIAGWGILPSEICGENPMSVNIAIPGFDHTDLERLRTISGVVAVGTFESEQDLPDPLAARKAFFANQRSAA